MRLQLHIERVVVDAAFAGDVAQLQADLVAELTRLLSDGGKQGGGWAEQLQGHVHANGLPAAPLEPGRGALGERVGRAVFHRLTGVAGGAQTAGAPTAGAPAAAVTP